MMKSERDDIAKIIKAGKEAAEKAIEENFALDLPITVLEDGYLVEIYKNGDKKKIKKIMNAGKRTKN